MSENWVRIYVAQNIEKVIDILRDHGGFNIEAEYLTGNQGAIKAYIQERIGVIFQSEKWSNNIEIFRAEGVSFLALTCVYLLREARDHFVLEWLLLERLDIVDVR